MHKLFTIVLTLTLFFAVASTAIAAPWVPAGNQVTPNDRFVAYYPEGRHAIAGESNDQYYGRDLVMRRGNTGQFHQWFEGTDPNGKFVAIHSVWNTANHGTCPKNWITIPNAYPLWGYYMEQGATYCVHNNYYLGTHK
jgi:hypothetical protein